MYESLSLVKSEREYQSTLKLAHGNMRIAFENLTEETCTKIHLLLFTKFFRIHSFFFFLFFFFTLNRNISAEAALFFSFGFFHITVFLSCLHLICRTYSNLCTLFTKHRSIAVSNVVSAQCIQAKASSQRYSQLNIAYGGFQSPKISWIRLGPHRT